jgi:hypothetical protein
MPHDLHGRSFRHLQPWQRRSPFGRVPSKSPRENPGDDLANRPRRTLPGPMQTNALPCANAKRARCAGPTGWVKCIDGSPTAPPETTRAASRVPYAC